MKEKPIVLKESFIFFSVLLFMSHASSKDLGVQGPLFAIEEENLLAAVQRKLNFLAQSGKIDELNSNLQKQMKERAENPPVVHNLPRAPRTVSRLFDPSILTKEAIHDHKGNIVVKAGTRMNPLDYLNWGAPLLLIDGTDQEQIEWASKNTGSWVLTKGNPLKVSDENTRWVYFDQGGIIVRRFNLKHLPARISQKGKRLLVEEICFEDFFSNSFLKNSPSKEIDIPLFKDHTPNISNFKGV
jgi:conjugal transfer pilus assembly protein TraW